MLKNKRFWTILIIILIIGGSYYYYASIAAAPETAVAEPEIQTAIARQGDLTISATGAGTVIAATEADLSFAAGGTLAELLVQVGDEVQTGDVLARIDAAAARTALTNSELQLAQTIMQTDADGTETGISFHEISVEQARINWEQAQASLDDLLNWELDADEIAQAEAVLASAQASYNAALGQSAASGNSILVQQISLDQAQRSLVDAEEAYTTAFDPGRDWELNDPRRATALENERDAAENNLLRAQESLQVAQANYNSTVATSGSGSVASAEAAVLNAELALAAVQDGPTEDEITAAETAVRQAQLAYQQALLNQEAAFLSLEQAQLNLAAAQETLAATELIAPMDGVVTAINYHVGEQVAGAFLTAANLDPPTVEVYVDETDMSMVGLDFEVEVIFDALPDDVFTGHVVQIDPQLSNVNGVTAVRALVQLDAASFAKPQTLPIGLNATVDVIGGRAENALLVPVEALRELSPDEFAVFVMENDEPVLRFVEVGIMDYTYAEILSGLEAGETVTTGIVETE
ncbi:MAG: HlyD family efflux transporter periplasmic adaptor subunit [Chloroflexi bacterium]|nr:HlyD family efflux transporter periplasmic adaptor subunit [Chloroflexota bacterium]